MAEFDKIPIKEAKKMKKKVTREPKILNEYIGYINSLAPSEAGRFRLRDDKEGFAIRNRIKRAAKQLRVEIAVKKFGDEIVFYKGKKSPK